MGVGPGLVPVEGSLAAVAERHSSIDPAATAPNKLTAPLAQQLGTRDLPSGGQHP